MLDVNKLHAHTPVLNILRWAMLYEIKRHPNRDYPVYWINDEKTNTPWNGRSLISLMTFSRGFGLRSFFAFQNDPAFEDSFGKAAMETLRSEAEVVLLMPNMRNPSTLSLWEKTLGRMSYISKNNSGTRDAFGVKGFSYHEDSKFVMDFDQLRRSKKGILLIRQNRPLFVDLFPVWLIAPYKRMIGQNPSHKSTPRKLAKIQIRRMPLLLRLARLIMGGKR